MELLAPLFLLFLGALLAFGFYGRSAIAASDATGMLAHAAPLGFGIAAVLTYGALRTGASRPGAGMLFCVTAATSLLALAAARRSPFVLRLAARPSSVPRWLSFAFVIVVILVLSVFSYLDAYRPHGAWDAMAIWNVRARFLYLGTPPWEELFGALRIGHPDYPLALPASIAAQYEIAGGVNGAMPQLTAFLWLGSLALFFYSAVRRVAGAASAVSATMLLLLTPNVVVVGQAQLADLPVAVLFLAVVTQCTRLLAADRTVSCLVVGFELGVLAFMKNEGMALALLIAVVFGSCLLARRRSIAPGRLGFRLVAGAALPVICLLSFKLEWAPRNDLVGGIQGRFLENIGDADRWRTAGAGLWRELGCVDALRRWGVGWLVIGLGIVSFARRNSVRAPGLPFAATVLSLALAGWYLVYVITPAARGQAWHIETSMHRLLLQLYPAALWFAFALFGSWRRGGDGAEVGGGDEHAHQDSNLGPTD